MYYKLPSDKPQIHFLLSLLSGGLAILFGWVSHIFSPKEDDLPLVCLWIILVALTLQMIVISSVFGFSVFFFTLQRRSVLGHLYALIFPLMILSQLLGWVIMSRLPSGWAIMGTVLFLNVGICYVKTKNPLTKSPPNQPDQLLGEQP